MLDHYLRNIDYMRVSITDRCNLRCAYCMPHDTDLVDNKSILTYEEILSICKCASELGISKIRITGGEPLVRKEALSLIKKLKEIPKIEQVTLSTNGVLLEQYVQELKAIPIDGVNVSLDTLDPNTYKKITGRDEFDRVWKGIHKLIESGIPTKINCVPQRGVNDHELMEIVDLVTKLQVDVRFIEVMPIGYGKQFMPIKGNDIYHEILHKYSDIVVCNRKLGNGPATYITSPSWIGNVGFINAVTHKFCSYCNRVRLTSTGYLKACLCYEDGIDLRELIRSGADESTIIKKMSEVIRNKPLEHNFYQENVSNKNIDRHEMYKIGG